MLKKRALVCRLIRIGLIIQLLSLRYSNILFIMSIPWEDWLCDCFFFCIQCVRFFSHCNFHFIFGLHAKSYYIFHADENPVNWIMHMMKCMNYHILFVLCMRWIWLREENKNWANSFKWLLIFYSALLFNINLINIWWELCKKTPSNQINIQLQCEIVSISLSPRSAWENRYRSLCWRLN